MYTKSQMKKKSGPSTSTPSMFRNIYLHCHLLTLPTLTSIPLGQENFSSYSKSYVQFFTPKNKKNLYLPKGKEAPLLKGSKNKNE